MAELSPFIRTDHKAVDKNDPLHAVKSWLTGESKDRPIVLDGGKAFGIINERALMGRHLDLHTHIHKYTLATRALPAEARLSAARAKMAEFRAAYLPIEDAQHRLAGYVRAIDIARGELDGQMARDVAVPVTTLREDQTMGDAVSAFHKEYVEWLPVLRSDGKLGGVLSRAQVLRMEFGSADKGRSDRRGEKKSMLDERVDGFMDGTSSILLPNARAGALLDALEKNGYAIVGPRDGAPEGVVTAETLFQAGPT